MIAVTSSQAVWYLTRGTGVVSLLLLTTVTVLGVLNSIRWAPPRQPRFVLQRIHRNVSLAAVAFILVHIATAVLDGFAPIRWLDTVVPFGSAYRPIWLGLGAVAFDLLIAVVITSLLRARLGYRAWRAVHWTSYGLWAIAIFHGLGVGSDTRQAWMLALVAASVAAVLAAVVRRLVVGWRGWNPARVGLALGAIVVPVVLGAWVVVAPLRPGWAARAGTPKELLATSSSVSVVSAPSAPAAPAPIVLPARASGQGTTKLDRLPGGLARVTVTLRTRDGTPLDIRVVLNGRQFGTGVSMTNGSVVLTPPDGAAAYRGAVTGLEGGNVAATLTDGHGDQIGLSLALQIASSGETSAQVAIQALASGAAQA